MMAMTRGVELLDVFFFQAEDGIRDVAVTGVQTCALPIFAGLPMVVRVAQRAGLSGATRCVVAADDESIVAACAAHGVAAVLTRSDHASGKIGRASCRERV